MNPKWLEWGRKLQAIAQNGLSYACGPYDTERYELVRSIATEMISDESHTDPKIVRDIYTSETGYATPKIDVRGAVFAGDSILLVKEKADGCWTLPGGWAEVGESPSEAVEREVFEESGYRVRAVRLLAICDRGKRRHPPAPFHIYKLFFECQILEDRPEPPPVSVETDAAEFFSFD
ncbi:MAG: NUDIX hydrolase N-terminal domain-containing protein, partial [Firmicutes bacterium]|nr:NUDIX hydrolase N-terminal domain-containing protein [Bacillota bacterium]